MKKSTTSAAVVPAAIIEDAWQEVGASFERFCLTTGVATLAGMLEEDATRVCGRRYGRADGRAGHRSSLNVSSWSGSVPVGAWPAELVGVAQPATRRARARTPPERGLGSRARHAA